MKITGSGKIETAPVRRKNETRPGNGAGFSLEQTDATDTGGPKPVSGAGPVAGVGALLSIQEVDDQGAGRKGVLNRAEEMLDLLDEIRHGLLKGMLPAQKLRRLLALSKVRREGFIEPKLDGILSDIELRAKVELAKLEMSKISY